MTKTELRRLLASKPRTWTWAGGLLEFRWVDGFPSGRWEFVLGFEDLGSGGFRNRGEGQAQTLAGAVREVARLLSLG